jgi:hypothetical protein
VRHRSPLVIPTGAKRSGGDLQFSRKVENLTFQQSLALDLRGLFIKTGAYPDFPLRDAGKDHMCGSP